MTQPGPDEPPGQSARPRPGMSLLARAGNLEYDRVLFFSDAIFAIAITLLVLEIPRPTGEGTQKALHAAAPDIESFAISFAVIGMFWMAHHSTFRHITVLDRRVVALNLLFCGLIAFLPYPTALLKEDSATPWAATVFYAACMTAVGGVETIIWLYASHANRLTPGLTATERQYVAARVIRVPVVFGLSIPVALVSATAGSLFWLLIWASAVSIDRYFRPRLLAARPAGPGPVS